MEQRLALFRDLLGRKFLYLRVELGIGPGIVFKQAAKIGTGVHVGFLR
jgi:hypothetical protein